MDDLSRKSTAQGGVVMATSLSIEEAAGRRVSSNAPSVLTMVFFLSTGDFAPILFVDPVAVREGFCCCERVATAADMAMER